ncbi:MAG: aldehyde dehydrogenase family protein [Proteobacteria bacterium]|nr:aldehyde dehydrogenase family protein [Pseudomonadota bacterium]
MSTQIVLATKHELNNSAVTIEKFELEEKILAQKEYFKTNVTKDIPFRLNQLKRLKNLIRQYEQPLLEALKKDLGKDYMESYLCEIMFVINELNYSIKKLKTWAKPKVAENSFFLSPASSKITYEPYGVTLIISPWNYPFLLAMRPLISAICAGNCVTLKCSESSPYTNNVILEMINQHFPQEYLYAIDCGAQETEKLCQLGYDFILYTGNSAVGKIIMQNAAQTLTPLILELGGKSPVIVDETADITLAAKRIVWSKFLNAGQTCVAPDYIHVHIEQKEKLINAIENQITKLYGQDALTNPHYGKIINFKQFQRLTSLLQSTKVIWGGNSDENQLKIEPTLVEVDSHYEQIMQEEIFGPILPILTYKDLDILISHMKKQPKPLALYHFSRNKESIHKINKSLSFGGGCVNDCMMQVTNKHLPFGGVGQSGFGSYIGEYGFKAFSHTKAIIERSKWIFADLLPITPPYSESKFKLFRMFAKLIGY